MKDQLLIEMCKHYGFDVEAVKTKKITGKDLFKSVPLFDPYKVGCSIGLLELLYYIDVKKSFFNGPQFPHKKIAQLVFEKLTSKEKLMVAEYIDFAENDYND